MAQPGVTYTAYGVGQKPIIMGSPENGADASKWELVSGTDNIYRYSTPLKDVGALILNGSSFAARLCPHIKNGGYTFGYEKLANGQFISVVTDSSVSDMTNYGEYRDKAVNTVYFRCDEGNPGNVYNSIEFNTYGYVIGRTDAYDNGNYMNQNITVDNLDIRYAGGHGIGFSSAKNLTVSNCEVSWIGGSVMAINSDTDGQGNSYYYASRYGNGVEVTGWCSGYTVQNCYIHDIYDAGITFQNGKTAYSTDREYNNVVWSGNLIENCCYSIEYFASSSSNGTNKTTIKNVSIENNIMRNAGLGLCEQRISEDSETSDGKRGFNLGSHINSWYNAENISANFVIKNNVFDSCIYNDNARIKSGLLIICASVKEYLPTMSGNIYVQHYGANFASFGVLNDALSLSWNAVFDIKAKGYAKAELGDADCSVYYVD